ncbi:MAG: signal peptidase II [Candidatus Omnitrophota bacterium]
MIRLIFLAVLLLDQISKHLILRTMVFNQSIPVVPSVFHLTLVANTGVAFGLFKGKAELFVLVGLVALLWIALFVRRRAIQNRLALLALALVSGGAVGNLLDRFRYGYVVDFLDFRVWPVFNVADTCISVGTVLFLITCLKK